MSIEKIRVNGIIQDIRDVEDVAALKGELINRLQGNSDETNSVTDPFKNLGNFSTPEDFNAAINALTYQGSSQGYGYFRATLGFRAVEIKSILMSSSQNIIGQVVQGMLVVADGKLKSTDSAYRIFFRLHQNGAWGAWKTVASTD